MRIRNSVNTYQQYKPNFQAIKLSNGDFAYARDIATRLIFSKSDCRGFMTYESVSGFEQKADIIKQIRESYSFEPNDFGVIFFPKNKETYIIARPESEQRLISKVKNMDNKAIIQLCI